MTELYGKVSRNAIKRLGIYAEAKELILARPTGSFNKHCSKKWNRKNVLELASHYKTISDFIKENYGAYSAAARHLKIIPELKQIFKR